MKITSASDGRWWRTQPKLPTPIPQPDLTQVQEQAFQNTWNKLLQGETPKDLYVPSYKYNYQSVDQTTKAIYDGQNQAVDKWYERQRNLRHHIPIDPDTNDTSVELDV